MAFVCGIEGVQIVVCCPSRVGMRHNIGIITGIEAVGAAHDIYRSRNARIIKIGRNQFFILLIHYQIGESSDHLINRKVDITIEGKADNTQALPVADHTVYGRRSVNGVYHERPPSVVISVVGEVDPVFLFAGLDDPFHRYIKV